jgi:hypothetical protein
MRAVKLLVAAGVVAVGAFLAIAVLTKAPSTADAAPTCKTIVYHPTDNSWTCASGPAGWYKACDYHVDGHRVRGWIDVAGSVEHRITAWAPSQGCTEWAGVAYGGIFITAIRTCTEGEGCSAWKQVH